MSFCLQTLFTLYIEQLDIFVYIECKISLSCGNIARVFSALGQYSRNSIWVRRETDERSHRFLLRYDTIRYVISLENWQASCQFNL